MKPDNLVIVRAGKHSLHPGWLDRAGHEEPDFDLLVAAYDKDAMGEDTAHVRYRLIPGSKVRGWDRILKVYAKVLGTYRQVALIDDDIETDARTLNQCFAMGHAHDLSLWQPSLTHDSFATYGASLQNDGFLLRYVNCIEMMCPFFKVSVLKKISPLFSLGFESGIDLVWCSMVREMGGQCAIIDACAVTHTMPVGGQKQLNGFVGKNYEDDIYRCLDLFGMKWPSWVAESALDRKHPTKVGGIALTLNALRPLFKFHRAPRGGRVERLKVSLDHIRHQALREPYYGAGVMKRLAQLDAMKRARQLEVAG